MDPFFHLTLAMLCTAALASILPNVGVPDHNPESTVPTGNSLTGSMPTEAALTETMPTEASLTEAAPTEAAPTEAAPTHSTAPLEADVSDETLFAYKQMLLELVFQMEEPVGGMPAEMPVVPYVMDRLYELLADRETGVEREHVPFRVDLVHGLPNTLSDTQPGRFYFNTSSIKETEDVIEAYLHVYKTSLSGLFSDLEDNVTVSLYKIVGEGELGDNGLQVEEMVKLQDKVVPAHSEEWLVFNMTLRDTTIEWMQNDSTNYGLLLIVTGPDGTDVSEAIVQRGLDIEGERRQPIFLVFTDREPRKDSNKQRTQTNIELVVNNLLNEQSQQVLVQQCEPTDAGELCRMVSNNATAETLDWSGYNDYDDDFMEAYAWEDETARRRRRVDSPRQTNSDVCQRQPLYISFEEIGWGRWVVAPAGIDIGYCVGTCPFSSTQLMETNHAVLLSVTNMYQPDVKKPCCVPKNLRRSTMLWMNKKEIVIKIFSNMVTTKCSCT